MSVMHKLEADSARLRLLEDGLNSQLAHVRGKLEGLQRAEIHLMALRDKLAELDEAE